MIEPFEPRAQNPAPLKIDDVSVTIFTWPVAPAPSHDGIPRGGDVPIGLLTIRTGAGIEGHSFSGAHNKGGERWSGDLLEYFKPLLMGTDARDIGRHWHAMWERSALIPLPVMAAVDIALWDIAGKAAGQPVHRLLGTCRDRIAVYASSYPFTADCAAEAEHYKELGWTAYKLHPFRDPGRDIQACREVRRAVGDGMVLMLDSMWSYSFEDAVRVGRAIEELGFFWYEDPLPTEDIYGYTKLCRDLDIPVMATELATGGPYGIAPYLVQHATDIVRGDAVLKGGITALMKIAHVAEAFRMKCEIHHAGNCLNNVANLHVSMAIPNCDYLEVFLPEGLKSYGLTEDIEVDEEGHVHAPERPGLGYDIDWDLVKRATTRVLR